ncbi:MAG: CapA family protein [Clostridia bacterium]|nr:CapA family protein [Clostridia bacterium]
MKILFAGDMCVSRFEEVISKDEMHKRLEGVKSAFDEADFSMLNLECVLYNGNNKPIIKSGPNLKGDPAFIECLNFLGVDVAGLANNHTGDYGDEAVTDTINLLNSNGIAAIGAGENIQQAYRPYIFEKNGLRVAVIAVCENEFGIADTDKIGAAGFNLRRVKNAIESAQNNSDKVIFFFHGGNEQNPFPSPEKTELYRLVTDLGADAVIAMHTHCPQGYEIYNGKPIVYSMGNFFFPVKPEGNKADLSGAWYFGYLSMLDITKDGISLEIKPYRSGGLADPVRLLEGEQKSAFMKYLEELSAPISDAKKIRHLFNIWCTMAGLSYAKYLNYSKEMEQNGAALCCHLKNNLACEAHNELVTNTLNMCYFDEVKKYIPLQDEIIKYQFIKL